MSLTFSTPISRYAGAIATALALTACGGGGSDAPPQTTSATTTFPLAAALVNSGKDTRTVPFTLSGTGTSGGQTIAFAGSGSISATIAPGTFEGAAAQVKTLTTTATVTAQGSSSPLVDTNVAFYDSNFQVLGASAASGYCVYSGAASVPASAKIGDTGALYLATCYTNSAKSVRTGTVAISFAVEPLTDTSAILRITQKATPVTGAASAQDFTYTITTAGVIGPRETPYVRTSGGVTVNFVFKFL
jgi:hypothetical protein